MSYWNHPISEDSEVNGVKPADIVFSRVSVRSPIRLVWMGRMTYCLLRNVFDSHVKS